MIEISGDSAEYEYINKGIELSKDVDGLCIELGLRRGMGTKTIIDGIKEFCPNKVSIAVDPYGNIEYFHKENDLIRLDYTNTMKNETMQSIHAYAENQNVHFIPFILEDVEFFNAFPDGVPIYLDSKKIINKYSFVHLDAGHAHHDIITQISFFEKRMDVGSCIVFDDVVGFYDHDLIETILFRIGFELIIKGNKKALYIKREQE